MTLTTGRASPSLLSLAGLGWFTGALFFFYAWVLRVAPSIMVEELMRDFAVGGAVLGNLSAFYFYGYAGMQVPIGLLLDRFGPRRLMTAAAIVCAFGCVLFGISGTLVQASAGRFLIGASAAFSLVGAMAVAGQWFPTQRFALLSGLAMMMGMAGGVFGQAPLRFAVAAFDWRTTMVLLSGGGVALALASWAFVRDRQRGTGGLGAMLAGLARVSRNRQTWLCAIAGMGAGGPLLGFASLWCVPYLEATKGLDRTTAAAIASVMFIGWGAGAPVFGWLSDRIGRRKPPFMAGLAMSGAAMAAIVYLPGLAVGAIAVLCFLTGLGGSAQIVCFALAREHNPVALSGTTIGLVNGMLTGAGALYQPLIGWMLDRAWDGRMLAGARIYDAGAYRSALAIVLVGCLAGFLATLMVRETHCRQQQ